jgi:hypothetical protein
MDMDPYDNLPTLEDLKETGAADWAHGVFSEQRKKDAPLKRSLDKERKNLRSERKELEALLAVPSLEPDDTPPDFFAAERADAAQQRAALSGLLGDLDEKARAEKAMLKNLFG